MCREQQYLHTGQCLPGCPAGHTEHGSGNFNRRCIPSDPVPDPDDPDDPAVAPPGATDGCLPKTNGCHVCADDDSGWVHMRSIALAPPHMYFASPPGARHPVG